MLIAFALVSVANAQKMKYIIVSCTMQGTNGAKDTVFNGRDGSITALVDLDAKTMAFEWKTPDINTIKNYTIEKSLIKKDDIYRTMGIYSIQLKCKNKSGKDCTAEIAVSERINKIDIVVVDGSYVLTYAAVEVETK